jgi:hypothetical protein
MVGAAAVVAVPAEAAPEEFAATPVVRGPEAMRV